MTLIGFSDVISLTQATCSFSLEKKELCKTPFGLLGYASSALATAPSASNTP